MQSQTDIDICIIGAGLSGLCAARVLTDAGRAVTILEKSRGLGGRAATRRVDGIPVDHGAQFFTARTPAFLHQVRQWLDAGVCFEWTRGVHQWQAGSLHAPDSAEAAPRYACAAGMTALARALSDSLTIRRETRVTQVTAQANRFHIALEDGTFLLARAVLLSAPAPQTLLLAGPLFSPGQQNQLTACSALPCLAVIAETPATPAWKGIQSPDHATLSWIGADFTKRPDPARHFIVLHASPAFSARHQDADLEAAANEILAAAAEIDPRGLCDLQYRQIHRWRFARHAARLEEIPFLRAPTPAPLFAIGDAFLGGRIESAWLSGHTAARALLDS